MHGDPSIGFVACRKSRKLAAGETPRLAARCLVPAALGVAIRHEWDLDPDFQTLNHGSYGATPRVSAPKGCGFLYARADRRAELHPVSISHGYGQGFTAEFDWTGTTDPSAYLALPAAIEFFERLGGVALMARNKALVAEAAVMLASELRTEIDGLRAPAARPRIDAVRGGSCAAGAAGGQRGQPGASAGRRDVTAALGVCLQ